MNLRNFSCVPAILFSLIVSASAPAQQNGAAAKGPQDDPNFPPAYNAWTVDGIPIYWTGGYANRPVVHFKGGPFYPGITTGDGAYFGFNEKGSLIQDQGNNKIHCWNFRELKLTLVANSFKEVPLDLLESLQNSDQTVQYYLAQNGRGPKPAPAAPPPPPPNPDKSAGLFGNNPRQSLQGLAPAAGSPFEIAGKSASIQGGVLTFTLPDGSKSKPYTVARPTFMANAAQAAGVTGTWIALQDGGKGIMFNVQADNSVTGKEIQPQVVQMMMQSAPKAH